MFEGKTGHGGPYSTVLCSILGVAMAARLLVLFPVGRVGWLVPVGWILLSLFAALGWVPIPAFRCHSRIAIGRSYIHTAGSVTSGAYAIVRHPRLAADSRGTGCTLALLVELGDPDELLTGSDILQPCLVGVR